jgi:hypothetical protein
MIVGTMIVSQKDFIMNKIVFIFPVFAFLTACTGAEFVYEESTATSFTTSDGGTPLSANVGRSWNVSSDAGTEADSEALPTLDSSTSTVDAAAEDAVNDAGTVANVITAITGKVKTKGSSCNGNCNN